jgi:hypothetical protein
MTFGRSLPLVLSLSLLTGLAGSLCAHTEEEEGHDPVPVGLGWEDTRIGRVLNHPSRILRRVGPGYEQYYYRGDAQALNDVLREFAATELPVREVALQPGVARTWATAKGRHVLHDWDLHLLTVTTLAPPEPPGVDPHRGQIPPRFGEVVVGRRNPSLAVFVGVGSFHLRDIDIPAGITLIGPADLRERYVQALGSDDGLERGEAAYCLAQLEPYNEANLPLFIGMLKEEGHAPYFAARALETMGPLAKPALPVLEAGLPNQDEVTTRRFRDAIERIENHKIDQRLVEAYRAGLAEIGDFLARLRAATEDEAAVGVLQDLLREWSPRFAGPWRRSWSGTGPPSPVGAPRNSGQTWRLGRDVRPVGRITPGRGGRHVDGCRPSASSSPACASAACGRGARRRPVPSASS